jgi:hypothetical protein
VRIGEVLGDDGRPLVETQGADPRTCSAWREILDRIDDELNIWGRLFRRKFGTTPEPTIREADDSQSSEEDEWDFEEDGAGEDRAET